MASKRLLGCALVLSCIAACDAKPTRAGKPRAAAAAGVQTPDPEAVKLPLGERLRREASRRPEARLHVDELLQTLASEGLELLRTRQVLAAPLAADYCVSGLSGSGLALSLCEFADADAAQRGLSRSHMTFDRLIPGRTLLLNRATLLTLTRPPNAAAAAESARLAARFSELSQRASL
jgi:hypothetical protein